MGRKLAFNVHADVDGTYKVFEKGTTPPKGVTVPDYAYEGGETADEADEDLVGVTPATPEPQKAPQQPQKR